LLALSDDRHFLGFDIESTRLYSFGKPGFKLKPAFNPISIFLEHLNTVITPLRLHREWVSLRYPGIALSALLCVAAMAISQRYSGPAMLFAVLIGLALHSSYESKSLQPGINWCARPLAQFGVALLGFRVDFSDIDAIGFIVPVLVLACLALTIIAGVLFTKALGMSKRFGVLISGAVAICGVSAAIAISSVLPKSPSSDRELSLTVAGVSVISTIAMILYPIISQWVSHTELESGIFIGASIHDVAQVVGAGYSISDGAGDTAVFLKLIRVSALLPVVLAIGYLVGRTSIKDEQKSSFFFPTFLIAYFIIAAANTLHLLPELIVQIGVKMSKVCLVTAIVANGLKTDLKDIALMGRTPLLALVSITVFMAAISLIGIYLLP